MHRSTNSSLTGPGKSSTILNNLLINDQKDISATNFIQSCSYHIENIDRNAIIKRQDMEACLKRLSNRNDVHGVIVATMDGRILYDCDALKKWIPVLAPLCSFARHLVRNNDPNDSIQALRLRTKTYELLITIHNEQLLIVMQMLPMNDMNHADSSSIIEEDWDAFLKRIQQKKIKTK
ncbi:unnamed protein product [Rotaria magnacalcarata]|uniref:Roadblock/LAMTOR2 domain-containing protein n=1 Tax=Rotaria magnacalcarata TaxID=392030 RepID=A0A820BQ37_9BILA|nr:unnamed protein product [Rotaria magnacalcarata]CAF1345648.1 unnamed protein product [Rotaria magnacalcarata]CAF2060348.1 unnamed protein product [Rotaria magnacalcarata]CAF2111407.1 unnamed protein product [Rotaria magnacalcarata]CAF2198758.1 unnamed protein product [Rotaria magnacalcarata]